MIAQLTETIDGSHALPEDKRAELRGVISTMPGLNRYLRVTPGGLLRVDAGKAKAEENLDGKYVFVPVGGFASGRFGEPRRRTAGNEDGAIRAEARHRRSGRGRHLPGPGFPGVTADPQADVTVHPPTGEDGTFWLRVTLNHHGLVRGQRCSPLCCTSTGLRSAASSPGRCSPPADTG